ncbi:DNA repair protein XRCC4 isoform X1 [Chiloscyllium plagiosum]|uniref:DNA repair protein XRCC4 isoform X1 n=1 Tax=Chiloscyllium plagiosum TaxID=36176 RepID=UPI001CB83B2A|nr:DNA repair protein XRCC4 isoform X1 [Chiloscyllium plagiosum]XP_043564426.1 DNA repair protein XRCC4 isoform X1 [Chiloscyllium plagiosum]XP_043564433.1 DNA repair protein XRCC4 isoform X1 [Chiloscyllium plagiosum]
MERHVCRIWPLSSPDTVHYMQISWEKERDLGSGFVVTLCNGEQAWSGRVSENQVTMEAKEAEMDREKYVDELRQALTMGEERMKKYSFDFFKDKDKEVFHFLYEKLLQDISFKLGSVELRKVSDSKEVIKGLIDYVLHCNRELRDTNEHLQQENERLLSDRNYNLKELEKYVKAKEELEQDLYSRFTLVLNEKKAKIRNLRENLKRFDEQVEFKSQNRSVAATSQEVSVPEENFDCSTDEESKGHTSENRIWSQPSRPTKVPPQSDPICSSLSDLVDVAPCRKRRHRFPQQKNKVEEIPQGSQEKRSCPMSSTSSAIHHQDEEEESQKTLPNTVEADDLFENI